MLHEENPSIESEGLPNHDYRSINSLQERSTSMSDFSRNSSIPDGELLHAVNPSIEAHEGLPGHDSQSTNSLQEINPSMRDFSRDFDVPDGGAVACLNEGDMLERIEKVVEPMTEMFVTFFKPSDIATKLLSLDDIEKQAILKDSLYNPERGMCSLLERLIETGGRPLLEFYTLVTTMDDDSGLLPRALLNSSGGAKHYEISSMMHFIVELVEQRNLVKLRYADLKQIADGMVKERLLKSPKKSFESFKDPPESLLYLLTLGKRSNPHWPLILWSNLKALRPDLFKQGVEENEPSLASVESEHSFLSDSSSQDLSIANPSLPPSNCSTQFSKSRQRRALQKLQITPKNHLALESLVDSGALREDQITVDEVTELRRMRGAWNTTGEDGFSDGEDENEETELKVPHDNVSNLDVDLNLRDYQKELAEHALNGKNTIICARTGCGKTRVALHIIINHLKGHPGSKSKTRKVCFFARTVPLAFQQYKTIKKRLPEDFKINIFTGDSELSTDMHLLLDKLDVVVLTPMILQNHINRRNIEDLRVFSLLVFDECHHTREKEPYNTLMASYLDRKILGARDLPQVVGLTASFPVDKARNAAGAVDSILQLCANLDAHTVSVVVDNKVELDKLVPVPTESIEQLRDRDDDESYKKLIGVMEKLEAEALDCARDIANAEIIQILSTTPVENRKLQKYNNWTVELQNKAQELPLSSRETNLSVRLLMIIGQYLTKYHFALETHDLVHLQDVINYLDDCFAESKFDEFETSGETRLYDYFKELKNSMANLCHEDNPNLRRLVGVIRDKMLKPESASRGIVFVRTRAIAEALALWLNRHEDEEIRKLNAHIFTGTNAKESQGGMTQSQQNALVDKFKEGKVRLLVATSVAEEGMDVPECNLVIKYNHVGNEITTIQTRGRSRKVGGHSVLLAMDKICEKEMVNQKRTELMYAGIDIVRQMSNEDFIDQVVRNQIAGKEQRELDELMASENERKYKDKKFRMICKLCRKFFIESDNLRTLCGNHRIVVDRDVWDKKRIIILDPKYLNEIKIVGSVRCQSDVEDGTKCKGPLGALVFYSGNYFLAVGIKNFTIDEENKNKLRAVKKWKDLPYPLKELSTEDIKNYIRQKKDPASGYPGDSSSVPSGISSAGSFGVQDTEPVSDSHLASFAASTSSAKDSISSEQCREIYGRYEGLNSQAASSLSTYSSSSTHHDTKPKEVAISELDSGVAFGYASTSKE